MKIGILQSGHFLGATRGENEDYDALFRRMLMGHDFLFQTWNVVDMDFPESVKAADGWLITGSPHGAYDDLEFIAPLEDLIRAIFDAGQPLVGICFGHQIIAQAMGGTVKKFDGGWAAGHSVYDFSGAPIQLNAWHQDQVTVPPAGVDVLATSDFCENAALLYGRQALTVQAHPEFERDEMQMLIDVRGPNLPTELVEWAQQSLDKPTDNEAIADQIAGFLKAAHG